MSDTDDTQRVLSGGERVSLGPLTPEQALRALLAVDPDAEPVRDDQDKTSGKSRDEEEAPTE